MKFKTTISKQRLTLDIDAVVDMIVKAQREDGEIPWSEGDKTDPWDLVEAVMGLSIGGRITEARLSFDWMVRNQLEDGSWYASYRDGVPEDKTRDTNMTSYIAVGVFHHYLITGDIDFLKHMWETVRAGIDFVLDFQTPNGEIFWAKSPEGIVEPMALLTGSSSVYMSMKCALAIAKLLGHDMPDWQNAFVKLGDALKHKRHLFNISKFRFSMDWFYPILCGALSGTEAQRRVDKYWNRFVIEGQGVRCVVENPWVTIAETSEFILALSAMGNQPLAEIVFSWIQDRCFEDGSYWCGYTYPDITIWPEEKMTWTNGVVLMAADALYNLTPAGQIFNHRSWNGFEYTPIS